MSVVVRQHVAGDRDAAEALRDSAHRSATSLGGDPARRHPGLSFVAAKSRRFGVNHLDSSLPIEAEVSAPDLFTTALVRRGSVRHGDGRAVTELGAGAAVAVPREPSRTSLVDATVEVLYFPFDALHQVAWEHFDLAPGALRFDQPHVLQAAAASRWAQVVTHLRTELTRPVSLLEHDFIETDYLEDAAFIALNLFVNNAAHADHRRGPSWTAPAVARRGASYIDENAHLDISLSQIADAVGASPSELARAFVDHFGVTPATYLQRVRLHLVHGMLITSHPTDTVTVRSIAQRFGFRDHDAFVRLYVATFGRLPDNTLES